MGAEPDSVAYRLGGVQLQVESDDRPLLGELSATFGAPSTGHDGEPEFRLAARISADGGQEGFAHVALDSADAELTSPADLELGLAAPDFPFRLLPGGAPLTRFALAGEDEPFFLLNGGDCYVRKTPAWRRAVALLLLQRLMRARRDAIFFHAGSLALEGRALLLIGPKGAGKSTLTLALASRGHRLLGDEQACYRPRTREILPFLRPVGVKPGPRAAAVEQALRRLGRHPERDGMMRLAPAELLPGRVAVESAPLSAVVFLDGFAGAPRLDLVTPGRRELGSLQPVGSSLVNAPPGERVLQMARMLADARVARLVAGTPDDTAALLEERLRPWR